MSVVLADTWGERRTVKGSQNITLLVFCGGVFLLKMKRDNIWARRPTRFDVFIKDCVLAEVWNI
jgi:hypothetical protein